MENDLPCELNSVISLKLNFDNLQKFLDFLNLKSRKNQFQILEINNRLQEFNTINEALKEVNIKIEAINQKHDQMNVTVNYHSNKLLEVEKTSNGLDQVN